MSLFFDHFQRPSAEVLRIYSEELGKIPLAAIGNHEPYRWNRLNAAKEQITSFIPTDKKMHFVRSDAEAFSLAIRQVYLNDIYPTGKNHVLCIANESAAILNELETYKRLGICVEKLPVNAKGHLEIAHLKEAITPRTTLLALSWAHPLTGVIQPILEISEVCKKNGVQLFIQASDVIGKLYFNGEDLSFDFLAFDGRDFGSIEGTGLLFSNTKLKTDESSAGYLALSQALKEIERSMDSDCLEASQKCAAFEKKLCEFAQIHYSTSDRLPGVSCFSIPGIHADLLLNRLASKGVCASLGGNRWQKLEYILDHSAVSVRIRDQDTSTLLEMLRIENQALEKSKVL